MFSKYSSLSPLLTTYSINNNGSSERGTDDARDGADGVGDSHQDGGVLGSHVQVVHAEPGPGEAAQTQGQREEGDGGPAGHDQGSQGHEQRLAGNNSCEGLICSQETEHGKVQKT